MRIIVVVIPFLLHSHSFTLKEKILPYWFDTAQDVKRGGYLLNDDAVLGSKLPIEKQIVAQSRMIWGFSHAHLAGLSDADRNYLQAATQGYHFLLHYFLDPKQGGYFWSTRLDGKVLNDCKFLYGQAFVIYAFVEYYRASGNLDALNQALQLYRVIQRHLHDEKNKGWFEQTNRKWKELLPSDRRMQFKKGCCKTANAHLHWMEALTELYQASLDEAVKKSLIEALEINQTYFFPENPAHYAECRQLDWKETNNPTRDLPYGHNVEFAWLMIRAETVLGLTPSWNRFYALLDHALQYGYDHERGGLYSWGFQNRPAHDTEKIWWVQAEMLAALAEALQHRSNPRYEMILSKHLHFIQTYMVCPKDGIWICSVNADGSPKDTAKANSWKANYHDVRALLKVSKNRPH